MPFVAAATTAVGVVLLARLVLAPDRMPALVIRLAELTLAAGAAYLLDDPAAPVTASSPRPLWRRRLPSLVAGAATAAAACAAIMLLLRTGYAGPSAWRPGAEVVALVCLAVAASSVRARRGDAEPGSAVATAVVLLGLAAGWAESLAGVAIYIPAEGPPAPQLWAWLAAALAGCLVLAASSREPAAV